MIFKTVRQWDVPNSLLFGLKQLIRHVYAKLDKVASPMTNAVLAYSRDMPENVGSTLRRDQAHGQWYVLRLPDTWPQHFFSSHCASEVVINRLTRLILSCRSTLFHQNGTQSK